MSVSILMGSASDIGRMQGAVSALKEFDVHYEVNIMSAHRTPAEVEAHVKGGPARGVKVFICGAGMAAHLAGAVAAHTYLPVIGVPLSGSALAGTDALYATVQMPKGVPVATVAIDGSYNAGILAVQILATGDTVLAGKLLNYKNEMPKAIAEANKKVHEQIG
jgi:5-(carboxyamino)imidazole ribonucleotide mutase